MSIRHHYPIFPFAYSLLTQSDFYDSVAVCTKSFLRRGVRKFITHIIWFIRSEFFLKLGSKTGRSLKFSFYYSIWTFKNGNKTICNGTYKTFFFVINCVFLLGTPWTSSDEVKSLNSCQDLPLKVYIGQYLFQVIYVVEHYYYKIGVILLKVISGDRLNWYVNKEFTN